MEAVEPNLEGAKLTTLASHGKSIQKSSTLRLNVCQENDQCTMILSLISFPSTQQII